MLEDLRAARADEAGRRVVILSGELDMASAQLAEEVMTAPFDLLDLSGLEFLDSVGIRVLVRARAARSDRLPVRGAKPMIRRTLDLAGISDSFVYDDAAPDRAPSSH